MACAAAEHDRAGTAINVRNKKTAAKTIPEQVNEVFDRQQPSKRGEPKS